MLSGHTYAALERRLAAEGINPVHAKPFFSALQRVLPEDLLDHGAMFPAPLRTWVEKLDRTETFRPKETFRTESSDGFTEKYLLELSDKRQVETVRMGFPGRYTACLSTQVGCAMGCVFCATGKMGFGRNLSSGEIVAQAHHVERALRESQGGRIRNLVMMGMGEPLANFDALIEALEILTDNRGLNIGPSRVAISTVGHIPGILKLAKHPKRYSLAVSLHAASEEERGALVPVNRKWPLSDLLEACRQYSNLKKAKVFFAWTLIRGKNDTEDHAHRLGLLLRGMNAQVNLIPLNSTDGYEETAPADDVVLNFQRIVKTYDLPCTVRQRRGIDVDAGCGQLAVAGG